MRFPFEAMTVEQLVRYRVIHPSVAKDLPNDHPYERAVSMGFIQSYDVTQLAIDYLVPLRMPLYRIREVVGDSLSLTRVSRAMEQQLRGQDGLDWDGWNTSDLIPMFEDDDPCLPYHTSITVLGYVSPQEFRPVSYAQDKWEGCNEESEVEGAWYTRDSERWNLGSRVTHWMAISPPRNVKQ